MHFIISIAGLLLLACSNPGVVSEEQSAAGPSGSPVSAQLAGRAEGTGEAEKITLVSAGNMQIPRAAHTATLLRDSTVLICGGFAGSSSLSHTEIYDSRSKTFSAVEKLAFARSGHSATLLPDGKVLIAGGYNGNYLAATEIYDPETRTFTRGADMRVARSGHTATVLPGGNILFTGGTGMGWTFLRSAEIYDITSHQFSLTGPMSLARESHTATLLPNGDVLITGGHSGRRENIIIYDECERFDNKSERFVPAGRLKMPRHKHDAVLLADGTVFIIGGSDQRDGRGIYTTAEVFDPRTRSASVMTMKYGHYKLNGTSILLPDSNVLISGGAAEAEVYNFRKKTFQAITGSMGSARLFAAATLLTTGDVLITGGYNDANETSDGAWLAMKKDSF